MTLTSSDLNLINVSDDENDTETHNTDSLAFSENSEELNKSLNDAGLSDSLVKHFDSVASRRLKFNYKKDITSARQSVLDSIAGKIEANRDSIFEDLNSRFSLNQDAS